MVPDMKTLKYIPVEEYRLTDGTQTCAINFTDGQFCSFLGTRNFGTVDVCTPCQEDLQRSNGGLGHLIPTETCPVKVALSLDSIKEDAK